MRAHAVGTHHPRILGRVPRRYRAVRWQLYDPDVSDHRAPPPHGPRPARPFHLACRLRAWRRPRRDWPDDPRQHRGGQHGDVVITPLSEFGQPRRAPVVPPARSHANQRSDGLACLTRGSREPTAIGPAIPFAPPARPSTSTRDAPRGRVARVCRIPASRPLLAYRIFTCNTEPFGPVILQRHI